MKPIQDLKNELREKLPLGIDIALQSLKINIPADVEKYNDVILLEGRYRELHQNMLRGVMNDDEVQLEFNKLREAILNFINDLQEKDFVKQSAQQQTQAKAKQGKILYRIPNQMQVQKEVKCLIRIAFNEEILMTNLEKLNYDAIKDVRIAEVMGVDLIDPNEQPAFSIRTFSEEVQLIDEVDFTEWLFYVKPLMEGTFPLLIKVAVVEIVEGLERKREVVLEETVQVVATQPEAQEEGKFATADYNVQIAGAAAAAPATSGGIGLPPQLRQAGMVAVVVVVGLGAVMAIAAYFGLLNIFKEDPKEMIEQNGKGGGGQGKGGRDSDLSTDTSSVIILPTLAEYLDSASLVEVAPLLPGLEYVWKEDTLFIATNETGGQLPLQLDIINPQNDTVLLKENLVTVGEFIFYKIDPTALPNGLKLTVRDEQGQQQAQIIALPEYLKAKIAQSGNTSVDNSTKSNTNKTGKAATSAKTSTTKSNVNKKSSNNSANPSSNSNNNNNSANNNAANQSINNNATAINSNNPPLITFDKAARAPIYESCNTRALQRAKGDKLMRELDRAKTCTKNSIAHYIQGELSKTPEAINNTAEKRVSVVFTINEKGKVIVSSIVQDFGTEFKSKVQKVVESMPTFVPGQDERGKNVAITYSLPIVFKPN